MPEPNPAPPAPQPVPYPGYENVIDLPWGVDPAVSWLDYRCQVDVELDSGVVLHKILPQNDPTVDDLSTVDINDPNMDEVDDKGIDLHSFSTSTDIIQRMASSTYRFILRGRGIRAGYKIPIPALRKVGNAVPIPERQRAVQVIIGQFGGVPVWFAQWEISYIIAGPIGQATDDNDVVPFNPALKIRPDAELPVAIALPVPAPPADVALGVFEND